MNNTRPVVVFDSGVGGISVLREMVRLMPNENFLFFGDSANAPYGTRTLEDVRRLTVGHISRMVDAGAKAVCLACNTATSAAVDQLRELYDDIPIIGIEPAVKPAALSGGHPNVVVMATPMTLREQKFQRLIARFQADADIYSLPCPELVKYVEHGELTGVVVEGYLRERFGSLVGVRIDCVVLGCTHFPFLRDTIRKVLGDDVRLYDGGEGTARQMMRRLAECGLNADAANHGSVKIVNSLGSPEIMELSRRLLEMPEHGRLL